MNCLRLLPKISARQHHNRLDILFILLVLLRFASLACADQPSELRPWLDTPQSWKRDTDGPIISLGKPGDFDDTHLFAPMVAYENGGYKLWYCGSTGMVAERVFGLGLATSPDGRQFYKHPMNPVYRFVDGKHSILTPTLLRNPDGSTHREQGLLRMWFSSTWFGGSNGLHTLHEATRDNGIGWSNPSPPQMKHVYAPTVVKIDGIYRMWYIDVEHEPWIVRHADSHNGQDWQVTPDPVLVIDQKWEHGRLFYLTVMRIEGVYLMWCGSYWSERPSTTAIGFFASLDGLKWYKHSGNPVLRPDPTRSWESHYVTSQSVIRLSDNSFRMWYASRKKPPFVNKYFAINTAVWNPTFTSSHIRNTSSNSTATRLSSHRSMKSKSTLQLRVKNCSP